MFLILCLHLVAFTVFAQDAQRTMTNDDVVEMVKAEVPEAVIIKAIRESESDFDTSTKTVVELYRKGVSPQILEAMIQPDAAASKNENENPPKTCQPANLACVQGSAPNEVLLISRGQRTPMKRSQTNSRFTGVSVFAKTRFHIYLENNRSLFRLTDRTPEFETSLPSDIDASEKLVLVRFKSGSGRRDVEIDEYKGPRSHKGIENEFVVPTTFEALRTQTLADGRKYTLYMIKTVGPLSPGEYAFVPRSVFRDYYDFGIDLASP